MWDIWELSCLCNFPLKYWFSCCKWYSQCSQELQGCRKAGPLLTGKRHPFADANAPKHLGGSACARAHTHTHTHTHTHVEAYTPETAVNLGGVANVTCSYLAESKIQILGTGMDASDKKSRLKGIKFKIWTNILPTAECLHIVTPTQVEATRLDLDLLFQSALSLIEEILRQHRSVCQIPQCCPINRIAALPSRIRIEMGHTMVLHKGTAQVITPRFK